MSARQKNNTTIIKRSSRRPHASSHGGAWKVAFADFMLALMSLFMVMWIIGQVSEKDRKAIIFALNNQSIFDSHSLNPINLAHERNNPAIQDPAVPEARAYDKAVTNRTAAGADSHSTSNSAQLAQSQDERTQQDLQQALLQLVAGKQASDNVRVDKVAQGIRIVLNDDQHRMMFERSSTQITPYFKQLINSLVPVLSKSHYQMMIVGHTDATPFVQNNHNDNWSLSVNRAQSARQVLLHAGFASDRIVQLAGVADQKLLDTQQPKGAINRRIELIILSDKGMQQWESNFSTPAHSPASLP